MVAPAFSAWIVISTGDIAGVFAEAVRHSTHGRLVAVGSRRRETAEAFARRFPPARAHGSYEALLADPEVEAVYIATPRIASRRRGPENTSSARSR